MANSKLKNFSGAMKSQPKVRLVVIMSVIIGVGFTYFAFNKMSDNPVSNLEKGAKVANVPDVKAQKAGDKVDEKFRKLNEKEEQEKIKAAQKASGSASSIATMGPLEGIEERLAKKREEQKRAAELKRQKEREDLLARQRERLEAKRREKQTAAKSNKKDPITKFAADQWKEAYDGKYGLMEEIAKETNSREEASPELVANNDVVQQIKDERKAEMERAAAESEAMNVRNVDTDGVNQYQIPAGYVAYAVVDTMVNSDEPSPVLAHIVSGPLAGANVVGSFQRLNESVLIEFSQLSLGAETVGFSGVAVDPASNRTFLASSVDNHTFSRWAALFASALIEGMGEALENDGVTVTTDNAGNVTEQQPELSDEDLLKRGIGKIGETSAPIAAEYFNRPPTVTVDAGMPIGILFTGALAF